MAPRVKKIEIDRIRPILECVLVERYRTQLAALSLDVLLTEIESAGYRGASPAPAARLAEVQPKPKAKVKPRGRRRKRPAANGKRIRGNSADPTRPTTT
jgi:hypothetical protein